MGCWGLKFASFLILFVAGGIVLSGGIIFCVTGCSTEYKDCTLEMSEVELVSTDTIKCGSSCTVFEQEFSKVSGIGTCVILGDEKLYDYNQTYHAYFIVEEHYDVQFTICNMNPDTYNKQVRNGIIMVCIGGIAFLSSFVFGFFTFCE